MKGWIAGLLAVAPLAAMAQDVEHGALVAKRWCSNCHIVERSPSEGRADGLPSFVDIANRPGTSQQSLRALMTAEHERMPNFSLTTAEEHDLAAYILTLRK
jgi:mono/diheme cytochrome c family protein